MSLYNHNRRILIEGVPTGGVRVVGNSTRKLRWRQRESGTFLLYKKFTDRHDGKDHVREEKIVIQYHSVCRFESVKCKCKMHLDEFPIGSYLKVKFSLKTLSLFWYLSEEKSFYII